MQIQKVIAKIERSLLKNAALIKQCDLSISDRASLDASKTVKRGVKAIYESRNDEKNVKKCKHFDKMPYHELPNACVYQMTKVSHNWLSAIFGVLDRQNNGKEVLNWKNGEANRFMKYSFNTLGHYRDEAERTGPNANRKRNTYMYWHMAKNLLKNKVFQEMAVNHVCPNNHMHQTEREIKRIFAAIQKIVENELVSIPMRRVYIEKSNGKWRPLGVPEISWRAYLHMWNCLIVWWREGKDRNHAYFPRKGIHTAWKELLPKLMRSENIYEFDLRSFFPSVNISAIEELLINKLGVPAAIAHYLMEMHRSITIIPKDQKMEERGDLTALLTPSDEVNPNLDPALKARISIALKKTGTERRKELESILPDGWTIYRTHGVPQGTATSCGVATISLYHIWQLLGEKLVMYADDGILFPSNTKEIENLRDEKRGIEPNQEKSGWAKKAGEWVKASVKFTGVEFIPGLNGAEASIRSNTRSGGKLEFNVAAQLLTYLRQRWSQLVDEKNGINNSLEYQFNSYSPHSRNRSALVPIGSTAVKVIWDSSETVSDWLRGQIKEFTQLTTEERLGLLFSKYGLRSLSEMFNGKWGIPSYEVKQQYVKGSWLHIHGARYQYWEIAHNWRIHLTIQYWKRILRVTMEEVALPPTPDEIWETVWEEVLTGKKLERCLKIKSEMIQAWDKFTQMEATDTFYITLNSLFKWNIPITKGRIDWDQHKHMRSLLKEFPFSKESVSTLAISDRLQNGFVSNRDVRGCIALKRKGTLVSCINKDEVPKELSKKGAEKDFEKDFGIKHQRLVPILSTVGLSHVD